MFFLLCEKLSSLPFQRSSPKSPLLPVLAKKNPPSGGFTSNRFSRIILDFACFCTAYFLPVYSSRIHPVKSFFELVLCYFPEPLGKNIFLFLFRHPHEKPYFTDPPQSLSLAVMLNSIQHPSFLRFSSCVLRSPTDSPRRVQNLGAKTPKHFDGL